MGLQRGMYNLLPPPAGSSEGISLELAATIDHDGKDTGRYWPMVDSGSNYGQSYGQIGYVVHIDTILKAGVRLYKTPLGSYTVLEGGVDVSLICA
eukprot:2741740-Heterocapsa_arctica.AAC.1